MKVTDPFAALQVERNHQAAVDLALQSNAAEYIRFAIAQHLADLEEFADDINEPFARGYRVGLRVALSVAGLQVDGSEEAWAQVVEDARG